MGDAAVVVNLGGGNGGTRIQVTGHACNFGVAQFLRNRCTLLGIRCIVFGNEFEPGFSATDHDASCIEVFNGHTGAVFIVFAIGGLRARDWRYMPDLDDHVLCQGDACRGRDGGGNGNFQFDVHEQLLGE